MKQLSILIFMSILIFSCKKNKNNLPDAWKGDQKYGWVKAQRKGADWEASGAWLYTPGDSRTFGLSLVTGDGLVAMESLVFVGIPAMPGTFSLLPITQSELGKSPGCVYAIGYADQLRAFWEVDLKKENRIIVDEFDRESKIVKGHFCLHLNGKAPGYPNGVDFEHGIFEVRLME